MNITLRQLKVFAAVASNQSFTRAAEEMHLTQPAVSMQVKQLENQLNMPLIEHLGKKIYLSEAGREVHHYSRAVSQQLDEMEAVLDGLKGLERGRLTLSIVATANYFAPRLLGAFCGRHPGLEVNLDVDNRQTLIAQLKENEVDMVIMGRAPADMDLVAARIMDNPLVVIAPPGHPLAGRKDIPLSSLAGEVFLIREPGSGTRKAMEDFFAGHGVAIATGMEVSSVEAIKKSVEAGLGLGLMSRDAVGMELDLGRLAILDVRHLSILRHWYLIHRKAKRLSPQAQAFKDFVLEEAAGVLEKKAG